MRSILGAGLLLLTAAQGVAAQPPTPASVKASPQRDEDSQSMVLARFGQFLASDSAFKPIYGVGYVYGGELRIAGPRLAGRRIVVWAEGSYRQRRGHFSFTGERTDVKVTVAEGGLLYRLLRGNASPYIGGGVGYHMFLETNDPRGEAKQNKVGYCGVAGLSVAAGHLAVDIRAKYSKSQMQPADFRIDVGGITVGGGIGLRF